MSAKHLFLVQDDDRSLYVIAKDFTEAIAKWQKQIRHENEDEHPDHFAPLPTGVHKIAEDDDVCRDFN